MDNATVGCQWTKKPGHRAALGQGAFADGFLQYGGSPVKVGEEEYSLFRDHE